MTQKLDFTGIAGFWSRKKPYTSGVDNPVDIVDKYMVLYLLYCG